MKFYNPTTEAKTREWLATSKKPHKVHDRRADWLNTLAIIDAQEAYETADDYAAATAREIDALEAYDREPLEICGCRFDGYWED